MYKVNNYGGTLYLNDEPILRFKYKNSDLVELELFDFDPKTFSYISSAFFLYKCSSKS